jgi:NAD(P)-dependent dehydrogenase (short-subunit alcohol dehydrogenase family)
VLGVGHEAAQRRAADLPQRPEREPQHQTDVVEGVAGHRHSIGDPGREVGQQALDLGDLQLERGYDGATAYRRSKLAQIMFTLDLAAELDPAAVTVNALHPATFMNTPMVIEAGGQPMSTVEEGGAATLRLIEDPVVAGVTGRFYDGTRAADPHPQAADAAVRAGLRRATDELLAARPPSSTPDDPHSQEDHAA